MRSCLRARWMRDRTVPTGTAVASAIFVAIALSMIIACLLGVAIPAVLRAMKADPRIAAGPVVLASADVVTLLLYFGLGARLLA